MKAHSPLLQRIAQARLRAPATRRAILEVVLQDPDRALNESFEQLAERSGSSVPTIMRTCRDLGFAGLREFKLALAQDLAVGGSPLHRRVNLKDSTAHVVAKIALSAAATVSGIRNQLHEPTLQQAVKLIAKARHIDIVGAGNTSWFMASDLQARLFRLGLSCTACWTRLRWHAAKAPKSLPSPAQAPRWPSVQTCCWACRSPTMPSCTWASMLIWFT